MKKVGLYIIALLLAFSGATIISALWTYNLSLQAARGNLKTAATNIAINLDFTLNHLGLRRHYFQKLVASGEWEAVAFLALYEKGGTVRLHSNPDLIGTKEDVPFVNKVFRMGIPLEHVSTLKTGEKVYILDYPVQLRVGKKAGVYVLRIALHRYPSLGVVRRARVHLTLSLAGVGVVWLLSFLLLFYMGRSYRMERELGEQKRLALLGEMAAVLAHEIRNPLGSIKGFAQFLMEKKGEADPEREYLQTMVRESVRLEKLVNDLLSYARQEEPTVSTFLAAELLRECASQTVESAKGQGIHIQVEAPEGLYLHTDRDKLKQIILNLMQNSVEAAEQTDTIKVSAGKKEKMAFIRIEDRGRGMERDTLQRIFQPFFTTKSQGTGLGLAIVKRLLDQLGGGIHVESKPGVGTTVEITIPL